MPAHASQLSQLLVRAANGTDGRAYERVIEIAMQRLVRVPPPEVMPPGLLARGRIDDELIRRGILTAEELYPQRDDEHRPFGEERKFAPPLAEKLRMLFDAEFSRISDLRTRAVWVAGDLLQFDGDFDKYVSGRGLARQEGIIFRHLLRLILVCEEFAQVCPDELTEAEWQDELRTLSGQLTVSCRAIDPESTDKAIEAAHNISDVVAGETG